MKKKHGFIFLTLGIALLVLFGLYKYTNLFVVNTNIPDDDDDTPVITGFSYDYVKSHDTNKKTRISYLVNNELPIIDDTNDYYKYYTNPDGLSITATIEKFDGTIKTYSNNQLNALKRDYEKDGQTVSTSDIECNHLCSRDKVVKSDGSILLDEIRLYIQISPSELFELIYRLDNKELSNEVINNVINNIKITEDAKYQIGTIDEEISKLFLDFELKNDEIIRVVLNSDKYEEIVSGTNTDKMTTVRRIDSNTEARLIVRYKRNNNSLEKDVDTFWGTFDSKKEITLGDKKFYEYTTEDTVNYAYLMGDKVLLIQTIKGKIDINDFTNITVMDVS